MFLSVMCFFCPSDPSRFVEAQTSFSVANFLNLAARNWATYAQHLFQVRKALVLQPFLIV
jgi:hypothetical protein